MESVLKKILATPEEADPVLLIALVDSIRPKDPNVGEVATTNLLALITVLRMHPEYAIALRSYVLALFEKRRHSHLYADIGILSNEGFFTTVWNRFIFRLLPEEIRDDYLKDMFGLVFHIHTDYLWVDQIPDEIWIELLKCIDLDAQPYHHGWAKIQEEMLDAVQMLSYRIASTGLEHELVRHYPDIERFESPFWRRTPRPANITGPIMHISGEPLLCLTTRISPYCAAMRRCAGKGAQAICTKWCEHQSYIPLAARASNDQAAGNFAGIARPERNHDTQFGFAA